MTEDQIRLYKKAGGSIIDHKPVFSANLKILYIGCGPVLRLFSTDTGEHIQDIEFGAITCHKPEGSIVDLCLHPFDKNVVIICFEEGRIIAWSFETNSVISNIAFNTNARRVVRMKLYVVSEEYETIDLIVATKLKSNDVQLSIFSYSTGLLKNTIKKEFNFLMHSWSVTERDGKNFLAGIHHNALSVYNMKTGKLNKDIMIGSKRYYTCVACHPTEECVGAADNTGRVLVYYDFLKSDSQSPFYVFHWHTLAVNDIVFSQAGSMFYSGGNEHVLVKWTVEAPDVRYFLPRLPAPIVHVTVAPDNQYIAISTLDNGILIVDSLNKIHCSLQQFTWGFISVPGQKLFPSGLIVDPRSDCIVMNGKPGHIQFFSPHYSSLIYNMDIVGQNYVSQERTKHVTNAEVVAVNFSSDGIWLATSQWRDDTDFHSDTLLKFWIFDRTSQSYKLASCITLQSIVKKILFQPLNGQEFSDEGFDYFVATLCSDNKFRFWINDAGRKATSWSCHSIGYYKDYELNDICFSSDGSLLGAAFGPCLTLWDTETSSMKSSLTKGSKKLEQIVFGSGDCSFIAITSTDTTICAWNLLSLTLIWNLDLNVSFIVADPRSEFVATFTIENSVFIFRASSADIVYRKDNLCEDDNDVLSATFFPAPNKVDFQNSSSSSHWLSNSSLYFFTSSQELMAFEYQGKESKLGNLAVISEKSPVTPFQALVAKQKTSDVKKNEIKSHLQLGASWSQTASQFIHSPAHAMPPVHLLSEALLKSLIISRNA